MLYQMKIFNLNKLQTEFLMLADFHYNRVSQSILEMEVDDEVKMQMMTSISAFRTELF